MIYLTADDVLAIHSRVIGASGGLDGLRDRDALEAALAAPLQSFGGAALFHTELEKIARAAYGLAANHAFIDGNKRTYTEAYEMALSVLRPGGFVLADNTLWDGHVLETPRPTDRQTIGIETFNDFIAHDNRVEKVILPLRDGLTIAMKK